MTTEHKSGKGEGKTKWSIAHENMLPFPHTCGYHCVVPACIEAQRKYLVERYITAPASATEGVSEYKKWVSVEPVKRSGFEYMEGFVAGFKSGSRI
jgi:hypothetical protein